MCEEARKLLIKHKRNLFLKKVGNTALYLSTPVIVTIYSIINSNPFVLDDVFIGGHIINEYNSLNYSSLDNPSDSINYENIEDANDFNGKVIIYGGWQKNDIDDNYTRTKTVYTISNYDKNIIHSALVNNDIEYLSKYIEGIIVTEEEYSTVISQEEKTESIHIFDYEFNENLAILKKENKIDNLEDIGYYLLSVIGLSIISTWYINKNLQEKISDSIKLSKMELDYYKEIYEEYTKKRSL